jgi:N-acetylmuramoyl-L-alanine amidase
LATPRIITARKLGLGFANIFGELGPELHVTGHYSAGPRAKDAREGAARVRSFHDEHRRKGWGGIAYHYVIPDDGTLICARPTLLKGAHVGGHNSNNIGVCMPGTIGDRPTPAQRETYRWLLDHAHTGEMPRAHRTDRNLRQARRHGHNQWPDNPTQCTGDFLHMYLAG